MADVFSIIAGINLGSGVDAIQYDFCEKPPSSISGRVHADEHEDCDFDHPEILLEASSIELLDANGNVVATTTTDANGEYQFDGLRHGEYQVRELQPAEYYDGGERVGSVGGASAIGDRYDSSDIHLPAGTDAIQYDFCEKVGVMLSGYVYHDRAMTASSIARAATSRRASPASCVKLLDGSGNDTGLRATTDAAGFYKFNNLRAGKYSVWKFIRPAGSTARTRRATWAAWPTFRRRAT